MSNDNVLTCMAGISSIFHPADYDILVGIDLSIGRTRARLVLLGLCDTLNVPTLYACTNLILGHC